MRSKPPPIPAPCYDDITSDEFLSMEDPEWRRGIWAVNRGQLERLVAVDNNLLGVKPENPVPLVAKLFVAYNEIIKRLDFVWSLTFQYQKSQAMRRFVDAATTRLEELKDALTELDISEYHYLDNELIELKLIPRDLEIIPLSAYPIERSAQLQDLAERLFKGERIYIDPETIEEDEEDEDEQKNVNKFKNRPVVVVEIDPVFEAQKEAIFIIQMHERARTARLEFLDELTVYLIKQNITPIRKIPKEVKEDAAIKIQKLWRGYLVRRDMKKRYYRTRMLLSMDIPSYRSTVLQDNIKVFDLIKKKRREEKVQEYIDTCLKEKERVLRVVGPGLMEDIGDEIRWWFQNWYNVALAFDKYPTEEQGGTIMVIRGETMTPEEYRDEQERKRVEKAKMKNNPALAKKMKEEAAKKKKAAKEAAAKEKARIKKEKLEAKKRAKKGIVEPFTFKEGPGYGQMINAKENYELEWTQLDEDIAVDDKLVMHRITGDKCYEVQLEMRKIVDEMMRLELELLQAAHARDRKGKKGKKGKGKGKKKKGKKGKGKKGKKVKDMTANRQVEDLFQELYDNGIIRPYPETDLNAFKGDYAYRNVELRDLFEDPLPCVGEAKQLVVNNCIIPLGGRNISKPKSVLIVGPRQSGKKLLVNAICTATSAVMFDLSPRALAGKYPGKNDMKLLVHLINKMSRILQPSVLFIDGAEKTFYKKVPKPEKSWEPKKLKSKLFKMIVKTILPEDRVMLIGTTNQPWAAKQPPLLKCYEKFICIPRTDYGTCHQVWTETLMSYHGVQRDLDVSAIAKLSIGYPIPYIREVANIVLCPARLIRLKFEPLRQHEILEGLMMSGQPEPVTKQEQDKFTTWFNKKTKIGKMRTKVFGPLKQKRLQEEAQLQKQKNRK